MTKKLNKKIKNTRGRRLPTPEELEKKYPVCGFARNWIEIEKKKSKARGNKK